MDSIQCHISINNRSHVHLKLVEPGGSEGKDPADIYLTWGVFETGPVEDIPPQTPEPVLAFIVTGRPGLPGGATGSLKYQLGDDANATVSIDFDVTARPGGANTVTATTSDVDIAASVSGLVGSGQVEVCGVKVVDGR